MSAGIFELWLIAGEEYDVDKFMQLIDGFDNKVFDKTQTRTSRHPRAWSTCDRPIISSMSSCFGATEATDTPVRATMVRFCDIAV
jgi:hypothetical protein